MILKKEDFKDLLYNVIEAPKDVAILSHFKTLGEYPEFNLPLDNMMEKHRSKIVKYVVLMYDRKSPFKKIEDITERKIQAALKAGFSPKRSKSNKRKYFSPHVDNMLKGRMKEVNQMIVRYCRIQGNMKYAYIVAAREDFYNSIAQSMHKSEHETPNEAKIRQGMLSEAKKNMKDVEDAVLDLLSEDNSLLIKQELYEVIEEEDRRRLRISPESRLENDTEEEE